MEYLHREKIIICITLFMEEIPLLSHPFEVLFQVHYSMYTNIGLKITSTHKMRQSYSNITTM